jgi:pimeloyl-ACP methyl ester carboxylesterase
MKPSEWGLGHLSEKALRGVAAGIVACVGIAGGDMGADAHNDPSNNNKPRYTLAKPMTLVDEGSFFIGGKQIQTAFPSPNPTGLNGPGTYTVNQMYVHYRIPANSENKLPVIMVHGSNHTGMTYETTPDGREGWATYFVRQGYPVYVVDHAGRGRSGFDPTPVNQAIAQQDLSKLPAAGFQRYAWEGAWVNFLFGPSYGNAWPGQRFPLSSLEQYTAQLVPNTEVTLVNGTANTINDLALLLDKIGPAIVVVHSQSGVMGLGAVVQRPKLVKGLISVEGGCDIPAGADVPNTFAKVPYLSFWGDYSVGAVGANGDARRTTCQATVATFKNAGGKAQFLLLPDFGIRGNSHMLMMDNNNLKLADILLGWVHQNVEKRNGGHDHDDDHDCDRDRNKNCH